jgi:dihydroxyacetone kinase-like predicted kinase
MIKVHVHVNDPGKVISKALEYGSLLTVKDENMKNQHTALSGGADENLEKEPQKAEEPTPTSENSPMCRSIRTAPTDSWRSAPARA